MLAIGVMVGCSSSDDPAPEPKETAKSYISTLPEFQKMSFLFKADASLIYEQHKIDTLFGLRQVVHVALLKAGTASLKLKIAAADPNVKFEKTSTIAKRVDALLAINGSYFDGAGAPSFYLKIDDRVVNPTGGPNTERGEGIFYIDKQGVCHIAYRPSDFTEVSAIAQYAFGAGPVLLANGEEQPNGDPVWNGATRARTAIGIRQNGDVLLAVVDETLASDASALAAGVTVQQMGKLLKRLGCVSAINFDGGGSSVMYIGTLGVVSFPSDGSSDNTMVSTRERSVQNILAITR
jgi:exopolysaccharide biosynthesis protein